jgi:CRP-like cAMP-binding protein
MGLFSSNHKRSATVVCDTDVELLAISKSNVMQLYYQNPKFGFYLVQLVTDRLLEKRRY